MDGNYNCKAYSDLGRRNCQREKDEDLAPQVMKVVCKRDKIYICCIQHEFYAQQDDNDITPDQDSHESGEEHKRTENEVVVKGDTHDSGDSGKSFFESTTAPTMATSKISDATSKGKR